MAKGTCTVPTCDEPMLCRKICNGHYIRWKKTGDVQSHIPLAKRAKRNPGARCSVPECPNANTGGGICDTHRERLKVHGDVQAEIPIRRRGRRRVTGCNYPGCPLPHVARGWCTTHYKRWEVNGDPSISNARVRSTCKVDDCVELVEGHGLCRVHLDRLKRTGDVQADRPVGYRPPPQTCSREGCDSAVKAKGLCSQHYWEHRREIVREDPVALAARREYGRKYLEGWRARHPGRARALHAAWRSANRETARANDRRRAKLVREASSIRFTADQLLARMAYWGDRCWMCGGPFEHVDHVKPLSKGGLHALMNLRPACADCNVRKKDKWPFPVRTRLAT